VNASKPAAKAFVAKNNSTMENLTTLDQCQAPHPQIQCPTGSCLTVRFMIASMSASHHIFNEADAPANGDAQKWQQIR
jgi:hypothetical protein